MYSLLNKAAINICVQVFVCTCKEVFWVNTKEYNCQVVWKEYACFFFRKLPYGLPRLLCHFALSPAVDDTSYCITSCWQCSGFGHSDRCIAMSYCCFDSHFPDDTSCEAFFSCVYLSSVYILWWGVFWSLWPIFFFYCVICFLILEFLEFLLYFG